MKQGVREFKKEERELLGCETIASQLPYSFPNGTTVEEFGCTCAICDRDIQTSLIVGRLNTDFDGVMTVDAIGGCPDCRVGTPVRFRYYDDGRYMWMTKDGWRRAVPRGKPTGSKGSADYRLVGAALLAVIIIALNTLPIK